MGDVEIPFWLKGLPLAPEYHPTETEFADPIAYISKIEKEASAFGICKVIPPLPKPSKKYALSNLNKSLAKCPELGAEVTGCLTSQKGFGDGGNDVEVRAVFTTRQQELGLCSKRIKGPMPTQQMAVQKQVWQSGEVYTLDQFESKSKVFARSHLSGVKEVSPMVIESLFWKATSEKPIYVEYANDVPGSGFGEPEVSFRYIHKRKRRRGRFDQKRQESIIREKHRNINNTPCTREGLSSSSTSLSEETSRPLRQKSAALADGSDKEGTAGWKISNSPWNLQVIARSRGSLTRFMSDDIPGVTSPMIYIGMLFSWFAWHVEDHELHSLNFLHTGAPKTWYAIPGDYAFTLEEVVRVKGYGAHLDRLAALSLLGEKTTLLSPEVVVASGIPCCRLVQYPGEFVVTFPRAYHVGFSHGFNCGEAANFATPQWLKVAKEAAVRRAAMNYLPMLSHQQLLYMLTMSFISRVPRSLLPGVRSSRLRDRKKEEREILVKKSFLDDMVTENHRLSILLQKSSTTYAVLWDPDLLPLQTTISTTFPLPASVEAPGLLVEVKPLEYGEDGSYKGDVLPDSNENVTNSLSGKLSSLDSQKDDGYDDKSDSFRPCMEAMDFTDADDDDLPCGLHVDSGTLACVACGILGYPFMSIIQPSERASKELLNRESEVIQSALGNMESMKLPPPSDVYNECEVLQAAQENMESVQLPYTDVNGIFHDSNSDDGKTINVEFEAQSEQRENQSGDLYPRRIGHACAVEVPNAGRKSKLVENGPLECTSATNTTMPDAIADKEPKHIKECHLMRVSSNNVLNQCNLLCENCVSPVPVFSQISVSQPIPFTNNGGHENFQPNPITNNAKENDAQIDSSDGVYFSGELVESRGDRHEKVDARAEKDLTNRSAFGIEPYHKTEELHGVPTLKHGDLVNRLWNTSNIFLRPRTFCLEHALEVEELLQCQGGANVLIICHSDYPKIKAQAPFIAEQIGVDFNFKDIPMENASQAELELINFSIDDDTEECTEDWTTKLGLNLRHCVKLRKLSPSKQEKHKLVLGGLFTDQVLPSNFSTLKWLSRKSRTHHKGTGLSRFKLQATPQRKKHDDKLGCHSDGMVLMEDQVLDGFSEPRAVAQACSSRGRGRPKKHPPKVAGCGNDTRNSEEGDLDNNGSKHVLCQPAYSNEKTGNDSPKVADDPTPKSSELPLDILATRETKSISDTYESSMVPVSHTTDMLVEGSEIEQQIQTPGWTTMGGVVCFSERSAGLPDISISEVSSTEEPKMADEIGDPTSCVDTPAVESSKTDHRIWSLDETTVEGKVCDVASVCTATNSEILEEIHTTEETPVMNEACDSAKFRNLPAIADSASGSFKMQQDIETTEGTVATRKSFDSLPLTDEDTVITLMAEHSDMQPEIQIADEASKSDTHNSVKSEDLPSTDVTMGGSFEMTLDVQTAPEEDGTMCEVHNSSKSGGLFPMSIAMVGTTEMQKDTQKMDEREVAGIAFFTKGGEDKTNSKPVLVYSRLGKDRHKRKRMFDEKEHGQETYVGFTRSPCEGLRPRTQRNIDEGMEATVAVEQNKQSKKSKKMVSSSVGRKDDEKRKGFYACDLDGCRMSFLTKVDLNLHKQNRCTHKGCKRRFSSHKYAMRHQRVHDDDRPLKCPWKDCRMSFKWAWARTEHMRLHTGERPYQCKVEDCGLTFRFVSDFSRHRRKTGHYVS